MSLSAGAENGCGSIPAGRQSGVSRAVGTWYRKSQRHTDDNILPGLEAFRLCAVERIAHRVHVVPAAAAAAPVERADRFVQQVPVFVLERLSTGDDNVHGALGDVGHAGRGGQGEIEDGGVDRERFDPAFRQLSSQEQEEMGELTVPPWLDLPIRST